MTDILIIGGAHIDRKGYMQKPYIKGSSIPGTMLETIGGGAYNVAINLARLDFGVCFISPRTDGLVTRLISEQTKQLANFTDHPTKVAGPPPSYTALLDQDGDLVAALADMQLYDQLTADLILNKVTLEKLSAATCLVVDANFPKPVIKQIIDRAPKTCLICAMAISPAKALKFKDLLPKIHIFGLNLAEANALVTSSEQISNTGNATEQLKNMDLAGAIITNGPKPATAYTNSQQPSELKPPEINDIIDVTGAGDAAFSAFLAAHLNGMNDKRALKHALSASILTIQSAQTQNPDLSIKALEDIGAQYF